MKKAIITFTLAMTIVVAANATCFPNESNKWCIAEPIDNITSPQDWITMGINEYAWACLERQMANDANRQRQRLSNRHNRRGNHVVTKKTKRRRVARRANRHRRTRR